MKAERTPTDKAARCPKCHRLLAFRRPRDDGSTMIMIEVDWLALGGRLERNWRRLESGGGNRHQGKFTRSQLRELRFQGDDVPTLMLCGCNEVIEIDFAALGAWGRPI